MKTIINKQQRAIRSTAVLCIALVAVLALFSSISLHAQGYVVSNLVADLPGAAINTDTNLVNAWGLALLPNDMLVVNANGTDLAGLYKTDGTPTGNYVEVDSAPTGVVVNNS